MAIKHTFSSPKADGADTTLVRPSDWNASHDDGGMQINIDAVSQAVSVVSTAASNALSVGNAASNAASVVSNALSVETVDRISADNALSNAISAVSSLIVAGSDDGLVDGVDANHIWEHVLAGANITITESDESGAIVIAAGAAASVTSDELSIVSAQAASAINVVSNAVSVVSQALSVLSQATSVADAALSVRIDTQSQSISVISQQVSVLSQAHSVLSQAVSVADAALSVRIDTQSQAISVLSQLHSVLSQNVSVLSNAASNALSVANAASNAASIVSQALSVEIANRVSAVNVVSNVASNATSIANAASNAASIVSQALSILSQATSVADAALSVRVDTVSQAVSVVSAYLDLVGLTEAADTSRPFDFLVAGTNVTFTELADGNAIQIDATAGAGSVTSAEVQAVSAQAASALSQAISVFTLADQVLQSNINDISANLAFVVSNQASVSAAVTSINLALSNETSARITADNFFSATLDVFQINIDNAVSLASNAFSAVSALEVRVSAISGNAAGTDVIFGEGYETTKPWEYIIAGQNVTIVERGDTDGGAIEISVTVPTTVVVQGAQTISVAALANISGLVAAVSTGGLYRMDAMVLINRAAAGAITRLGLTFPSMTVARGYIRATLSAVQGLPAGTTEVVSSQGHFVPFNGNSASGSILVSTISAATTLSNLAVFQGLFLAAANGNIQLQIAASTSAGTGLTVLAGSYMQVFRLS